MISYFNSLDFTIQALIATLFTWFVTILGAAIVFLFKKVNKNVMDAMLGFASGVMIAASFWSLLSPSIDMSNSLGLCPWLTILIGFMGGGILLFTGDKLYERVTYKSDSKLKRIILLIFSITLHNIPEGMAIGVAFGSLAYSPAGATITNSCMLALGIGLQNFPEGAAVSLPLRREGFKRNKAFLYASLSGIVEPISAVIGSLLVIKIKYLLPYLLSFAAGAMIYVVIEELIPESQTNERKSLMSLFTLIGFSIMMILDVGLS